MTDTLSRAISDRETHRQIMELPCPERRVALECLEAKQQAHAKRIARKTAPGGKDD